MSEDSTGPSTTAIGALAPPAVERAARRFFVLQGLLHATAPALTALDVCRHAIDVVASAGSELPVALFYLVDGPRAWLAASAGILDDDSPACPREVDLTAVEDADVVWPIAAVVKASRSVQLDDVEQRLAPYSLGAIDVVPTTALVLPLVLPTHSRAVGVLIAGLHPSLGLDEACRDFLELVGRHVSTAIALASASGVRSHTLVTRIAESDATAEETERHRLLSDASAVLAASLDYEATLKSVAQLSVPILADFCFIDVLSREGLQRVAFHTDPEQQVRVDDSWVFVPAWDNHDHPVIKAIQTGEPELIADVDDVYLAQIANNPDHFAGMRDSGFRSLITVPLVARSRTLGALTLCFAASGRRHSARDLELAEDLASRAALAVDNARLYADAQRAIRSREDLLAVVSHDLRNPLSSILTSSAMLERRALAHSDDAARARKHADIIRRSVERMDRLIGDLLDLACIEAGALAIQQRVHAVGELIQEAIEAQQPLAKEKAIAIEAVLASPTLSVHCDRDRVLQIFTNLLGNAIKFTPDGGSITVRTELSPVEVRFTVQDTGPGIPPEELPHVFDRYWQARKRTRSGVGLGLSIVKGIVEAHGGRIWVESVLQAGSAFSFTLPREPAQRPARNDDETMPMATAPSEATVRRTTPASRAPLGQRGEA
jgi:signal transduction histidine kinase